MGSTISTIARRYRAGATRRIGTCLCLVSLGAGASTFALQPSLTGSVHAPRTPFVSSADQTWGGYAMLGAKPYKSITGSWNIPNMDCSRGSGDASPWIGIDGWSDQTVEQIGIDLDCSSAGVASYHTWVEMYPQASLYFPETVKAGDTLKASVSVSGSTWTLTESDPDQGWTKTFTRTSTDKLQSAEAIVEDIGNTSVPALDDFGTVTFSDLVVNGEPFATAGKAHITTMQRGTKILTSESALASEGFSISWLHR